MDNNTINRRDEQRADVENLVERYVIRDIYRNHKKKFDSIIKGIKDKDLRVLGYDSSRRQLIDRLVERGLNVFTVMRAIRLLVVLNRSRRYAQLLLTLAQLQVEFRVLYGYLRWRESINAAGYLKVKEEELDNISLLGLSFDNRFKIGLGLEEKEIESHGFHILDSSPWPFVISLTALSFVVSFVMYMHYDPESFYFLFRSGCCFLIVLMCWWRDIIRESTFLGYHTTKVQYGLKLGFILFLVSEVLFFFGFFWSFFHSSLSPAVELGSVWPPYGIVVMNPLGIPLLNTCILLFSALTITYTHYALINNVRDEIFKIFIGFVETLVCAVFFSLFQFEEYYMAPFAISDGVFGSLFYFITGLHGFHVLIGTAFIFVGFVRFLYDHYMVDHHLGFEFSIWYWHFVDLVWLYVFVFVYVWSIV